MGQFYSDVSDGKWVSFQPTLTVKVDKETGDMLEPRLLIQKGEVPPMEE